MNNSDELIRAANETMDKVASVGLHANMVLYLIKEYHMDNALAVNILFLWEPFPTFRQSLGLFCLILSWVGFVLLH